MLRPFYIKPKIYNKKLHDYIVESNKRYIRKLSENYEYNKKNMELNSAIQNFHKQNDKLNKDPLNNAQIFGSISCIFLVSNFMFYVYNLRK
jgi:hypothetical protein